MASRIPQRVMTRPGVRNRTSGSVQHGFTTNPTYPVPSQVPEGPQPLVGAWKTPVIDGKDLSAIGFQADVWRISGQSNLMGNIATPAKFQVEASLDGNSWELLTATSAPGIVNAKTLTQNVDGPLFQAPYNKPAYRYYQARLVLAGGAAVLGTVITAPANPKQNGTALAVSPDGLVLFYGSSTTPYLEAYNITVATSAFSAAVDPGVAMAGTVNDIDVIGPFGASSTYYVAVSLASTPYWAIIPYTVAGGFGTAITGTAFAGAALSVMWVPNVADPTKQVVFFGYTGAPGVTAYQFNASTGAIGAQCNLTSFQNGSGNPVVPGANVNDLAFSLDGNLLVTAETTSPYAHVFTVDANASPAIPLTGVAPDPVVLPGAACTCVAIHPSGEYVVLGSAANVYAYELMRNASAFNQPPYTNDSTNKLRVTWGKQQTTAGGLGNLAWICFHPNGSAIYFASASTPFVKGYPSQDFVTGALGTAETAPTAIVNMTAGKAVVFHPFGQYIYIAGTSSAAAGSVSGWPWLMDANVGITIFGADYV